MVIRQENIFSISTFSLTLIKDVEIISSNSKWDSIEISSLKSKGFFAVVNNYM